MSSLKEIRERQGQTPTELAAAAGISLPAYFDLENHADELSCAIAVESVARIARELSVKASTLYGGSSSRIVSTHDLALLVQEQVKNSGKSLAEFEEEVGWSIAGALENPEEFRKFNADGLRAVCSAVNVSWFDVLDGLI